MNFRTSLALTLALVSTTALADDTAFTWSCLRPLKGYISSNPNKSVYKCVYTNKNIPYNAALGYDLTNVDSTPQELVMREDFNGDPWWGYWYSDKFLCEAQKMSSSNDIGQMKGMWKGAWPRGRVEPSFHPSVDDIMGTWFDNEASLRSQYAGLDEAMIRKNMLFQAVGSASGMFGKIAADQASCAAHFEQYDVLLMQFQNEAEAAARHIADSAEAATKAKVWEAFNTIKRCLRAVDPNKGGLNDQLKSCSNEFYNTLKVIYPN